MQKNSAFPQVSEQCSVRKTHSYQDRRLELRGLISYNLPFQDMGAELALTESCQEGNTMCSSSSSFSVIHKLFSVI